jgi:hypothetical protein
MFKGLTIFFDCSCESLKLIKNDILIILLFRRSLDQLKACFRASQYLFCWLKKKTLTYFENGIFVILRFQHPTKGVIWGIIICFYMLSKKSTFVDKGILINLHFWCSTRVTYGAFYDVMVYFLMAGKKLQLLVKRIFL